MRTDDEFWTLIDSLGGVVDQDRADELSQQLAGLQTEQIVAFADRLSDLLHAIDDPAAAAQRVTDPTVDGDPFDMSDDLGPA